MPLVSTPCPAMPSLAPCGRGTVRRKVMNTQSVGRTATGSSDEAAVRGQEGTPLEIVVEGRPSSELSRALSAGWHLVGSLALNLCSLPLPLSTHPRERRQRAVGYGRAITTTASAAPRPAPGSGCTWTRPPMCAFAQSASGSRDGVLTQWAKRPFTGRKRLMTGRAVPQWYHVYLAPWQAVGPLRPEACDSCRRERL